MILMKRSTISAGGQISVPAEIRRRWATSRVLLEDRGDALVVRPVPDDPIGAAIGSLAKPGLTSDQARAAFRADEVAAEDRRLRRSRRPG